MRVLSAGCHGLLIEVEDAAAVGRWDAALRRCAGRHELTVTDIVPGARTVLLDGLADVEAARRLVGTLRPAETASTAAGDVGLEVVWDGPDLGDVAGQWAVAEPAVVEELTRNTLRVAFCGFAPGFAYLTGLPAGRSVARRRSPRTAVPAGSVGLAGPYAGIYPRSSPGGWQLVGRTSAVLFDADRDPPALLAPGTVVRLSTAGGSAP